MSEAELEVHVARQRELSAMQASVTELETERKALRLAVIGLLGIARETHDAVCDQQPVSESGDGCCRIWHRIQEAESAINVPDQRPAPTTALLTAR